MATSIRPAFSQSQDKMATSIRPVLSQSQDKVAECHQILNIEVSSQIVSLDIEVRRV